MNKTMDFAMEFRCAERKAEFIGYSIYSNNQHNAFNYGLVANEDVLHQKLCDEIGKNGNEQINRIKAALITTLNEIVAPYYEGFLGIDMLVFLDDSEQKRINPCVEMNLRCTMGVVTSIVGKRFFHPHSIGRYHVEFRKAPFDISAYMQQKISEGAIAVMAKRLSHEFAMYFEKGEAEKRINKQPRTPATAEITSAVRLIRLTATKFPQAIF